MDAYSFLDETNSVLLMPHITHAYILIFNSYYFKRILFVYILKKKPKP